jgi:hypothetical protein
MTTSVVQTNCLLNCTLHVVYNTTAGKLTEENTGVLNETSGAMILVPIAFWKQNPVNVYW